MSDRPILVTGCAGFIGSNLVDTLLAGGRDVVGIDAFEEFYSRARKERNLERAIASRRFNFAEIDTRNRDALRRIFADTRPSTVVDLAARAGVRDSLQNPWLYIDINVSGVQNLLSAIAEVGASLLFASSSSVYGDANPTPFREGASELRPISPYGATKVAGEALVGAHHVATGLPTRVARLFTVYGPRQRPDLAIHKFANALLTAQPVQLYDQGAGTRDYTYVGDIVDGLIRLIDARHEQLTVNLGSGRPFTTIDLVRHMEQAFGIEARITRLSRQPGDMAHTFADTSVALQELGWRPATALSDGLQKFREWFFAEVAPGELHTAVRS